MLKNHIKIAWRSLKKQPFFTFLNIFGLAIGIAGGLLISLYILDELSYDTMFADADRIHRVNADIKFGGEDRKFAVTPAPIAEAMNNDLSEVELTTRFRTRGSVLVKQSGTEVNVKELQSTFVDSTFFKMFGIKLLVGDKQTALKSPNTLVMTKTAAEKHFDIGNAVGQTLQLNNTQTFTVTGVIDDLPKNSFLRDHTVFMAMPGYEDSRIVNWGSNNYQTFIKLIPAANAADIQQPLRDFLGKYVIPGVQQFMPGITEEQFKAAGNHLIYSTIPLTDIHLNSDRVAEISPNNTIQSIYILSFIAAFLLVLASVNFMNLSTAHSLKRAKEVGVRKTLGSNKIDLIRQFLIESGLVSFGALLFAILIAVIALPFFNELADKDISIPYSNPFFWFILLAAGIFLGLFSGSYPAFFMSKFIPVEVLKGSNSNSLGGSRVRNGLVIFQFAISVFLIVSTLVVYQQLKYIQNKDLGFSKDQVLVVNDVYAIGDQIDSFKEEVKKLGYVKNATLSSFFPTPSARGDSTFGPEDGATDQERALSMQTWGVDQDYISTMGFEIVAGRNFDKQFKNDSTSIIINESAVATIGLPAEEVLGKRYTPDLGEENAEFYTIIGVVKDFHFSPFRDDIEALSLHLSNDAYALAVKLNTSEFQNAIAGVEAIWNKLAPGQPFDYYFMEDSFERTYRAEQRLSHIFFIFTTLSILIACLGLFGLAAFNAEKRTKEIGVRKVLGATVGQITYKLTQDFLRLVGIGILVALPIGWFAMDKWLQDFSYRINIGWEVFIIAPLLAVSIAIFTVSYQSIKAAIVNPVKSLRTE
ncbi:ABC transporter permease [Flagellimonas pacifica]|uniref:Putative ABC transport system permease protein n=1 Tax=Flagellimonas pacifica TaxID=1247520 RepID=A0A285MCR2_9FLAO|nr:ABC transporter permease [Allomuricauda parva]SNY94919.1 putative ABC transport system permease protein [Allomuricauda parva]